MWNLFFVLAAPNLNAAVRQRPLKNTYAGCSWRIIFRRLVTTVYIARFLASPCEKVDRRAKVVLPVFNRATAAVGPFFRFSSILALSLVLLFFF